ncbi:MAG: ATP-dependent Clp protease proteolytic subunit [Sharpea porci]
MNSQTNQMFVAQSVNGPFSIDAKAYLTSKIRKVTLNDEITSESIESLITLYFNTPGGSVNAAYHLIDFIEGAPVKFFDVVSEICASAGSLVFASLPEGHRFIMPHGKIMIHQPAITPNVMINSSSIKNLSEMIGDSERMIYQDLSRWTKHTVAEIERDCEKETWLKGQEAIDYGIADHLFSYRALSDAISLEEDIKF